MPRRRLAAKRRFDSLTPEQRDALLHEFSVLGRAVPEAFLTEDAMRLAWEIHRSALLAEFAITNPGQRPWGWWLFESPEPRARVR